MTEELKNEYLTKHIPYRINCLLAHDLMLYRKSKADFDIIKNFCEKHGVYHPYDDVLVVAPLFETSLLIGRSLLHFLHLGLDNDKDNPYKLKKKNPASGYKDTEVTIETLFPGKLATLGGSLESDPIVQRYSKELSILLKLADKSVAHLTMRISQVIQEEQAAMPSARKAIYELFLKHIPEIKKEDIWWYNEVGEGL